MTLFEYDARVRREGYPTVCGVDEAGRGPLAGRVYASACILPPDAVIQGLNDSKKLTAKKRDELYDIITDCAVDYAVAFADEHEIDELNILAASMLAMRRAAAQLTAKADIFLIDGNRHPRIPALCRPIVKGDGTSAAIAAASVLAKVSRDRYMDAMALQYPGYGFEKHRGYPTAEHYRSIAELGVCEIHRLTFLKNLEQKHSQPNKGVAGEDAAAKWLGDMGQKILCRNYRAREGEIDIITLDGDTVCFVEVKQRGAGAIDRPAAFVTAAKQRKIVAAAMRWLDEYSEGRPFEFDVVEIAEGEISIIKNAFSL